MNYPLDIVHLQAQAPSIFATTPYQGGDVYYGGKDHEMKFTKGASDKYVFVPTIKVVEALAAQGLVPYSAKESLTRIEGKRGFVKHQVRFRQVNIDSPQNVGDVLPEFLLTNSHDTGSSFIGKIGMFRLACTNGLIVSAGMQYMYRVIHKGTDFSEILSHTQRLVAEFPEMFKIVNDWKQVTLTVEQQAEFAARAIGLRWAEDKLPFPALRLLETRREADRGDDLWRVFNRVQENLIKEKHIYSRYDRRLGMKSTRAVKSIDTDMEINSGLWQLASEFAGK